jgi:hypothetical protein
MNICIIVLTGAILASCGGDHAGSPGAGMPDGPPGVPADLRVEVGSSWGHCILHWTPPAGTVDGYEVQSTVNGWIYVGNDSAIIPGNAVQAELDFSRVAKELTAIDLQIRARREGQASDYSPTGRFVMPVRPPVALAAALTPDGVRLGWYAFTSVATGIAIERAELDATGAHGAWSPLAAVPVATDPFSGNYLDPTVQIGKAYAYRVTATKDDGRSDSVETTTLRFAPGLARSMQTLPLAAMVAADGKGHYAFAGYPSAPFPGPLRLIWRNATDWATTDVPATGHGIKLDASGLPHAVYTKTPVSGTGVVIVHGRSDGTQWLEETVAQRVLTSTTVTPALQFELDAAANPVIAWNVGDGFEGAIKVGGAWQITPFDKLLPFNEGGWEYQVFSDRSGVVHALFAENGLWHLAAVNGTWTGEKIPVSPQVVEAGGYSPLLGAGRDPDHLVVCTELWPDNIHTFVPGCFRKTPAGWGNIERLGPLPFYGGPYFGWAAMSDDGNRLAILLRGDVMHLFRSDLGGPWTETLITPKQVVSPVFDAAGKLSVLSGDGTTPPTLTLGSYEVDAEP